MAKVHFTPPGTVRLALAILLLLAALSAPVFALSFQPMIFGGLGLASGLAHLVPTPAKTLDPVAAPTAIYPAGRGVLLVTLGADGRQVMRWKPL